MTLSTYATLQTALADHIGNRGDVTAATIRDFITLAEAKMRRKLKTRATIGRDTATISDPFSAVPADYGGAISFTITDQTPIVHLESVSPERLNELLRDVYTSTGTPAVYAVVGGEFGFAPEPSGSFAVELVYYRTLEALSDSNTSNWILDSYPDAYLNGALAEAAPYMVDDPRGPIWERKFAIAIEEILQAGIAESFGGRLNVGEHRVA